ncbi:MAG TPA: WhiB family transcriptional regulator [Acidimicrobiales bacterium]|nr:WhiB family transcriptional regulator [Acidimicrobiales bacterium]
MRWITLDWERHAICRGMDTELFFGTQSGEVAAAIEICRGCPVRSDCLHRALREPDVRGVWGGTSEGERRRMRRAGSALPSSRRATVRQ